MSNEPTYVLADSEGTPLAHCRFDSLAVAKEFAQIELQGQRVLIHRVILDENGVVAKDFGIVAEEPETVLN